MEAAEPLSKRLGLRQTGGSGRNLAHVASENINRKLAGMLGQVACMTSGMPVSSPLLEQGIYEKWHEADCCSSELVWKHQFASPAAVRMLA